MIPRELLQPSVFYPVYPAVAHGSPVNQPVLYYHRQKCGPRIHRPAAFISNRSDSLVRPADSIHKELIRASLRPLVIAFHHHTAAGLACVCSASHPPHAVAEHYELAPFPLQFLRYAICLRCEHIVLLRIARAYDAGKGYADLAACLPFLLWHAAAYYAPYTRRYHYQCRSQQQLRSVIRKAKKSVYCHW